MILNENKVEEAAKDYSKNFLSLGRKVDSKADFSIGVSYAESQLSELAIEFYDWMQKFQDLSAAKRILEVDSSKELFNEFLKQRDNGK